VLFLCFAHLREEPFLKEAEFPFREWLKPVGNFVPKREIILQGCKIENPNGKVILQSCKIESEIRKSFYKDVKSIPKTGNHFTRL